MKKAFLHTYFTLIFIVCFSQSNESEVIATSGEYFEGAGISISWTLGETINETFSNENIILTQGFQQKNSSQTEIQEYLFSEGYQFVSSRIIPENPDMLDVLENILNENLDFIRNSSGNMLRKIGPVWVNGIGDWITTEGYLFKMNGPDNLTISGLSINPQTPINLSTGYQMISFLPDEQQNTSVVFENILENLDFVRNTSGNMFRKIGSVWVNGIGNMQPGEGYLVKMKTNDILFYPEEVKNLFANQKLKPEHFQVSDGNPYDPVWTIYFERGVLETGDEIAIFDKKRLVGAAVVGSDNIFENAIPVFSNLYEIGSNPIIKVWDKSQNKEFILNNYEFENNYEDAYNRKIFPSEDGQYSLLKFSTTGISDKSKINDISIYPNPSEGIFNISLKGVSGKVQVKVFDVHANNYQFFEMEGIETFATKQLDLKELPAGVYFIRLSSKDFNQVKKIVIQ